MARRGAARRGMARRMQAYASVKKGCTDAINSPSFPETCRGIWKTLDMNKDVRITY